MAASHRLLQWLLIALIALALITAVISIGFALGLFHPPFVEIPDLVERLAAIRADDARIYSFVLINSLSTLGVFLIGAMLGAALRPLAAPTSTRDVMSTLFVVGGVIGVIGLLANIGLAQAATFGICDCNYRQEELIAQDYALSIGWSITNWLGLGAVTIFGVGAALAGRLISVGPAWTTLSYLIAAILLFGVALRFLSYYLFLENIDLFQISDIIVNLAAGILVPIWAIMLLRSIRDRRDETEAAAA